MAYSPSMVWRGLARGYLPAALVGLAYLCMLHRNLSGVHTPPPWPQFSFVDFRDTVWVPVRDLFSGFDPYATGPYLHRHPQSQAFLLYHPAVLVLFAPFAAVPLPLAAAAWAVVLAACFVLVWRTAARVAGIPTDTLWVGLAAALVLISAVVRQPMSAGQVAVITATGAIVALAVPPAGFADAGQSAASRHTLLIAAPARWAVVAATFGMLKPQVALPLVGLLLVRGMARTALTAALLSVVVGLPVIIAGVAHEGGIGAFITTLRDNLSASSVSPYTFGGRPGSSRIDVIGSLQRLGVNPGSTAIALITLATAAFCLVLARRCWLAYRANPHADGPRLAWWTAVAATMVAWTPNELYAAITAIPAVLLGLRLMITSGLPAVVTALPGLILLIPFVHIHRIDDMIGIGRPAQSLNGLSFLVALLLAALLATSRSALPQIGRSCADSA